MNPVIIAPVQRLLNAIGAAVGADSVSMHSEFQHLLKQTNEYLQLHSVFCTIVKCVAVLRYTPFLHFSHQRARDSL